MAVSVRFFRLSTASISTRSSFLFYGSIFPAPPEIRKSIRRPFVADIQKKIKIKITDVLRAAEESRRSCPAPTAARPSAGQRRAVKSRLYRLKNIIIYNNIIKYDKFTGERAEELRGFRIEQKKINTSRRYIY